MLMQPDDDGAGGVVWVVVGTALAFGGAGR
jgi:hypothetical protein